MTRKVPSGFGINSINLIGNLLFAACRQFPAQVLLFPNGQINRGLIFYKHEPLEILSGVFGLARGRMITNLKFPVNPEQEVPHEKTDRFYHSDPAGWHDPGR